MSSSSCGCDLDEEDCTEATSSENPDYSSNADDYGDPDGSFMTSGNEYNEEDVSDFLDDHSPRRLNVSITLGNPTLDGEQSQRAAMWQLA